MKKNTKDNMQRVGRKRIDYLFCLAKASFAKYPKRSKRYVEIARAIGTRYNIRFFKKWKVQFCKKCGAYWVIGKNVTVRTSSSHKSVEYSCQDCGTVKRFGYSKK